MNSEFLPTARPPQDAGACAVGWPSWRLEPMAAVLRMIQLIGPADVTALVLGETGVGKEMVAQALHRVSPRKNGPFVKINCAAMPFELLESELFGYERGAFTGAERRKLGRFEQANRGTIFLDEIAEMAPSLQAKLLHVLQDGTFSRLGGREDIRADVRVVAATNRDLRGLVERGEFREDLYYRLCVVNIRVPALRDRPDEIPVLIGQFLESCAARDQVPRRELSAETVERLLRHHWPGNVRELENAIRQIVILGEDDCLLDTLLMRSRPEVRPPVMPLPEATPQRATSPREAMRVPFMPASSEMPVPFAEAMPAPDLLHVLGAEAQDVGLAVIGERARQQAEREAIHRALLSARWRRTDAARLLKINYRTLLRKMREYGLERE